MSNAPCVGARPPATARSKCRRARPSAAAAPCGCDGRAPAPRAGAAQRGAMGGRCSPLPAPAGGAGVPVDPPLRTSGRRASSSGRTLGVSQPTSSSQSSREAGRSSHQGLRAWASLVARPAARETSAIAAVLLRRALPSAARAQPIQRSDSDERGSSESRSRVPVRRPNAVETLWRGTLRQLECAGLGIPVVSGGTRRSRGGKCRARVEAPDRL